MGYEISILSGPNNESEGSLFDRAKESNVKVDVLPSLKRDIHPFFDLVAFAKIYRILKNNKYYIVHTHSSKAGIIGRLAAKMAKVPIIIHTVHGLPFHDYQNRLKRKVFILAEKFGASFSDKLIAVSNTIIEKALKERIGSKEKFVMIRSGFEIEKYLCPPKINIREKYNISPNEIVIGKIARFSELKGHKYLIQIIPEIVKEFPNVKFLFVGSGELEKIFKEKVKKLGIEKYTIFTGLVDSSEIPNFIFAMDIVIHTSLLEGLARVLPQALAAGKPAISFDIDGAHEVIVNDYTGYLVRPKDSEQLKDSIVKLISNIKKAKLLGENGRNIVKDKWNTDTMVEKIDSLYYECLENKKIYK